MTDGGRTAPGHGRGLLSRGRRSVAAWLAGPPPPPRDPLAEFRSLDGPVLVGGPRPLHDAGRDGDPRLVVLMPHLTIARMSGGPNSILQVTARLAARGFRLRYVAAFGPLDPDRAALLDHMRRVTGVVLDAETVDLEDASAPGATLRLGAGDVPLATWWPTAHVAAAALDVVRAREFVYFIQDFEPGFYAWSTKYQLALSTYDMPMRPIVNQPLLLDHLRTGRVGRFGHPGGGDDVAVFMPAVDRSLFRRRPRPAGRPPRLAFYARPRNPRNLFELGLRALRTAAAEGVFDGADWEFEAIGQALADLPLSARHVLRAGPWRSYDEYAGFLGETDVLLSLMLSPHTSYPPLEMAVAGGIAVTNTFGAKTAAALQAMSPSILAAEPTVGALVDALRAAVAATAAAAPPEAVALPESWDAALVDVVPWLARTVDELRGP